MPITPMRLLRIPEPFDHPEFLFGPKIDGFRALAHVTGHRCELVSRNGYVFRSWPQLAEEIAHAIRAHSAILDGEICCLEPDGRSHFTNLLFRREWPCFWTFDVLAIDGQDLQHLPLLARKRRVRGIMPRVGVPPAIRGSHRGSRAGFVPCVRGAGSRRHRRKVAPRHVSDGRPREFLAEDQECRVLADGRAARIVQCEPQARDAYPPVDTGSSTRVNRGHFDEAGHYRRRQNGARD